MEYDGMTVDTEVGRRLSFTFAVVVYLQILKTTKC